MFITNNEYLIKHAVVVQVVRCDDALELRLRQLLALFYKGRQGDSARYCCKDKPKPAIAAQSKSRYCCHHHACEGVSELCSIQRLVAIRVEHFEDLSNGPKHLITSIASHALAHSQSTSTYCLDSVAVTWSGGSFSKCCLMKELTSACAWSIAAAAVDPCAGLASAQSMLPSLVCRHSACLILCQHLSFIQVIQQSSYYGRVPFAMHLQKR